MSAIPASEVQQWLEQLTTGLSERYGGELSSFAMIGIRTGGVSVAQHLHSALALPLPLGQLNISFYRDDFSRIGLHPVVGPSELPINIEDRPVLLVDDVLHTGRTIRAAMNEIFDFGRPARVALAVLVQRQGRELPIQADVAGHTLELKPGQQLKLDPQTMQCELRESHD
jgi:pyrimidine operon attenuation protein/uracil phosphoribosyltransferase